MEMDELFRRNLDEHERLIGQLRGQIELVRDMALALIAAVEAGNRVYIIGNGGSAADAQHIAAELVGRFKCERRALPFIALTTDTSTLLSIGNDYGFGHVFTRQVEAMVEPGDVLWALSTSGNSSNVIEAVHVARGREACIIGFTGRSGGKLKPLCHYCLCADHDTSDRIQEVHQLAYHLICDAVEKHYAG